MDWHVGDDFSTIRMRPRLSNQLSIAHFLYYKSSHLIPYESNATLDFKATSLISIYINLIPS